MKLDLLEKKIVVSDIQCRRKRRKKKKGGDGRERDRQIEKEKQRERERERERERRWRNGGNGESGRQLRKKWKIKVLRMKGNQSPETKAKNEGI